MNIDGYTIGSGGPLDKITKISNVFSGSIILDRTHEKTGKKFVSIRNNTTFTTLKFRVPPTPKLKSNYYLTLPNGDVREFDFAKEFIDSNEYLIPGKKIDLSLPTSDTGTYLIEVLKEDGTAYINLPITR